MKPRELDPVDLEALEGLLDRYGLANLVAGVVTVTHLKAEHVRANWGDDALARLWDWAAYRLDQVVKTWMGEPI